MNTNKNLWWVGVVVAGAMMWTSLAVQLRGADAEDSLAVKINHAAVFYQSLMWVGEVAPSDAENQKVYAEIEKMKKFGGEAGIPGLETFVATCTNSPWRPSLQANLGRYYFENGLYTKAIQSWESVWTATKDAKDGNAKKIADFALAHWTHLLASLGRMDTLKALFVETEGRVYDGGAYQQKINEAKEGYHMMLTEPGVCFRCGTFALNNVARTMAGPAFDPAASEKILSIPSPVTGFSMTRLVELSKELGLNLVAARWSSEKNLVVPSVVHWKENHYVSLLQQKNGRILTVDPTFGQSRWLKVADIQEEASGYFMVPKEKLPQSWQVLTGAETDLVYGRGFVGGINEGDDGCGNSSGGSGGAGGGGGGGGSGPGSKGGGGNGNGKIGGPSGSASAAVGSSGGGDAAAMEASQAAAKGIGCNGGCSSSGSGENSNGGTGGNESSCCSNGSGGGGSGNSGEGGEPGVWAKYATATDPGMPVWEVSEPYINVWLYDEPLGYQPGIGSRISCRLAYKQREARAADDVFLQHFFNFGKKWDNSWTSYVIEDNSDISAKLVLSGGGERIYSLDDSTKEYYSHTTMQRLTNMAGMLTGFVVSYANGAKDWYTNIASAQIEMHNVALLSLRGDALGHATKYIYQDLSGPQITLLQYVVDGDGRTNTLSYANTNWQGQITGVQDPFGRNISLKYDTNNVLTNITDVAGLSSSFGYNSLGWVTNLTTPYGATKFEYWSNNTESAVGEFGKELDIGVYDPYLPIRSVRVIDAVGGTNVYLLRQDASHIYTNWNDFYNNNANYIDFIPDSYGVGVSPTFDYSHSPPPTTAPVDFDNRYLNYRNSFHWGPRQAAELPADVTAFPATDYIKARMRHWLHGPDGNPDPGTGSPVARGDISQTLSMQQAPSPNGITPGATTWYHYPGQAHTYVEGNGSQPDCIGSLLPDGTDWYQWIQRDDWGRPTNIVETYSTGYGATPQTRTNVYIYDGGGNNLAKFIAAGGETTTYGYDANNHLTSTTNAIGEVTRYTYDAQGRRTSVVRASSLTTTNIFYASGLYTNFVQMVIDLEIKRTNSYTYTNNLLWTSTDERGRTVTNLYDALQRLTNAADALGRVSYTYDRLDLVRVADRMGFTNSFGYDGVRRRIASTNALGNYVHYNYCSCGALESIENAAGNLTSFTYDNAGNLLSSTAPDGYSVYNYYDLLGRVTNTVDSAGASTTVWYNNQGLRYTATNLVGRLYFNQFDVEDLVTNSTDANGVSVAMTYDNLHRLLTRSYPDTGKEKYGYTPNLSGPTSYTNQIGNIVRYSYDVAGRKTNEIYVGVTTNSFAYSSASDLLVLTDGNASKTTWNYDTFGRVTNKVDNLGTNLFVYQYDADNRLTNRWSAAKTNTVYKYDAAGNLTNVVYPVSAQIKLRYDILNRLTNMVDGVGTNIYAYDSVGQLLSEDGPWIDDTVSYTYQNRRRASMSEPTSASAPWTQNYQYDSARRLRSIVSPAGEFDYTYDPVARQRVKLLSLPGGSYITNGFDNVARLSGTWLINNSGANLDSYVYDYNQANQRTKVTRLAGEYVDYTYDDMGELLTAKGKTSGNSSRVAEQLGYTYDAAGNLLWKTNFGVANGVMGLKVNSLNEITNSLVGQKSGGSWAASTPVSGGTVGSPTGVTLNGAAADLYVDGTFALGMNLDNGLNSFTAIVQNVSSQHATNISKVTVSYTNSVWQYDLNGNLLTDGTRNFAYDDENQLIAVWTTDGWSNSFAYDGKMRRRITKQYYWQVGYVGGTWIQTNEVHYIYDGNLVVQERDGSNNSLVEYTRGRDLSGTMQGAGGIGGLLARSQNSQSPASFYSMHSYYHADGNGNMTMLLYANGTVAAKYLYDPYGNTLAQSGPLADANSYRFSSKEWNQNSGLYYYLYRFYDGSLQRWVNRDPLSDLFHERLLIKRIEKLELLSRHTVNPFEALKNSNLNIYVENEPLNYFDPFGMDRLTCTANCGRTLLNDMATCGKASCSTMAAVFTSCMEIAEAMGAPPWEAAEPCALAVLGAGTAVEGACAGAALVNYSGCYTKCLIFGR